MLRFFDDAKRKTVLQMLALGLTRRSAAKCVGCHVQTIYNEIARSPKFRAQVREAESGFEARHKARIEKASEEPAKWRASVWSLERKFPDQYMPRPPRTISPDELEQMFAQFAEVLTAQIHDEALREQVMGTLWKVIDASVVPAEQRQLPDLTPKESSDA